MAKDNRVNLKSNFRTGDRPTQSQFEDVFDSFLSFNDDGLDVDGNTNLTVSGGITLTNTTNEPELEGTIRWNGAEFEGFGTSGWAPIGGTSESPWVNAGGDIEITSGNVGIGTSGTVDDMLEVNISNGQRIRAGNVAIGSAAGPATINLALFSHSDLRSNTQFAISQESTGKVTINGANGNNVFVAGNGTERFVFTNDGKLVVGTNSEIDTNSDYKLQVQGSAFKDDGEGEWNVTSDIRTKTNISEFTDGLLLLNKVKPISFTYNGKAGTREGLETIGIAAQEIEEIFPNMVRESTVIENTGFEKDEKVLRTNLSTMKFVMINAINELSERLEKMEKRLECFEKSS